MVEAALYNLANKKVGTIELPRNIFSIPWKPLVVHQVLRAMAGNRRKPLAHVKGRGEVRGGGRKPWRQKGTGRARHGSIRSPLWVGGGKAHGPTKERDYSQKINKKMRKLAMGSVLTKKLHEGEVKFFDSLELQEPKTKAASRVLRPLLGLRRQEKRLSLLLIPSPQNKHLSRAARNLPRVRVLPPASLNIEDLLSYRHIFIDQEAIPTIERTYHATP